MKIVAGAWVLGIGTALLLGSGDALARHRLVMPQDAPAAAKVDPAELKDGTLTAIIVSMEGTVEVKRPSDADFVEAQKSMELPEGTEIATGYNSKAQLAMTGQILVVIPSLSQVAVSKMLKEKGTLDTNLNIKFGSLDIDVKKGSVKTDLKVSTPNATTSVTGTRVLCRFQSDIAGNRGGNAAYHAEVSCRDGHVQTEEHHTDETTGETVTGDTTGLSGGDSTSLETGLSSPSDFQDLSTDTSSDPTVSFGLTTTEAGLDGGSNTTSDPTTGTTSSDAGGSSGGTVIIQETVITNTNTGTTVTDLPSPPTHP